MADESQGEVRVSSSVMGAAFDETRGLLYVTYRMSAEMDGQTYAYLVNGCFQMPDLATAQACTASLVKSYGASELHNWN